MKTVLFACFLLLTACSDNFSEAQLIGEYVGTYMGQTATLSLNADNTYKHIVQLKSGQRLETASAWRSSQVTSGPTRTVVEFTTFGVIPSFGHAKAKGWATEVERTWLGRIQLCFDSDVGYCYVKQAGR